jgi:heavy metal sensor kinase
VIGWWRSHSVRVRLTVWYLAAMAVVLAVYALAVYAFVGRSLSDVLDQQLRNDFQLAAASVYRTPELTFTWTEPEDPLAQSEPLWVQVWDEPGERLLFSSPEARRRSVQASRPLAREADNRVVSVPAGAFPFRILSRRGCVGPPELDRPACPSAVATPAVIQVGRSEEAMRLELGEVALLLLLSLPVALAVAGLGGYALARRALAPIERMTDRARSITAERLSDRLPVDNPDDEMGRLASVFNETLGRLEASFEQMRRFTADVSHELRTPLTAIRSVGEVGLRGHRDEAAYRGIVSSMLEEADRLASLVDRLLTLSRAETHQAMLSPEPVDLVELAENVAAHLGVLAEEKGQTIAIDRRGAPVTTADRLVLRQAVINLVDNAIKFTPAGGTITIRVSEAGGDAAVDVVDQGPGISSEGRRHVFDRFYREGGVAAAGTGLGLSIAKGAVEAIGGRIALHETGPAGSTFRIVMPRAPEARRRTG